MGVYKNIPKHVEANIAGRWGGAHLTSRTRGKRHPDNRQAMRVSTEAFGAESNGPSTSSAVHRGHLQ